MKRWPRKPLRDLCQFRHGNTPSKTESGNWGGSFPWVSPKDMRTDLISDTKDHLTAKVISEGRAAIAKKNSLLVVVRSGILAHTFPVAIAEADVAFNQDLKALRITTPTITPRFLFRFLQASSPQILTHGTKRGATVHSLQSGFLESLPMPVPSLPEQQRIVKLLDEADEMRKLRAQADRRTADFISASFHKMFGDPATNPKRWPIAAAGELMVSCEYGCSEKANDNGKGIAMLRMGNVTNAGLFDLTDLKHISLDARDLKRYRLAFGDVLFNRTNSRELVGKTGMWDGRVEAVAASYFIRIRFDCEREHPQHFTAFMNLPHMKKRLMEMARGAIGQSNINAQELKSIPVPLPPIPLQREFSQRVREIRELQGVQAQSRARLETLFASLLDKAFREEL